MLNFRNTNILFLALLAAMALINAFQPLPVYAYIILVFVYTLILFYGSSVIKSGFYLPVRCSAITGEKKIAISFDDGPSVNFTPQILDILNQHNVEAAFFCIGNRIEGNESLLNRIHKEGHLIGNHSFSHHFWFDMFSAGKMLGDMRLTDDAVQKHTNLKPLLFRPPYGVTNPNLKKAIIRGGYTPVGWSVRSMDTVIRDHKKLLEKISRGIAPGAVFLFHDTSRSAVEALPEFLSEIKNRGYEIVRIDRLLNVKAYA